MESERSNRDGPLLPGSTIGIVGGGQLGRMMTMFARRMGYRIHTLDPADDCPAGQLADRHTRAAFDDAAAAIDFARRVDVVTFEFENIPAETLAAMESVRPVRPSPRVLDICRNRLKEKDFLRSSGIPVAPYVAVGSADDVRAALLRLGAPAILKTADFGYDGKGQARLAADSDVESAWRDLGRPVGVVEGLVNFSREISVLCARGLSGESVCYPPAENEHVHHILDLTLCPARISTTLAKEAAELASRIAAALDLVGLIAVEMFVVNDAELIVNELAPRPHNSGHFTFEACATSQFEQQIRAVCGLPLGSCALLKPAAMVNLLGDLWENQEPDWNAALAVRGAALHLYGKDKPAIGRKMGHITALADTVDAAADIAQAARRALKTPQ